MVIEKNCISRNIVLFLQKQIVINAALLRHQRVENEAHAANQQIQLVMQQSQWLMRLHELPEEYSCVY
jgi:hypothetical protein